MAARETKKERARDITIAVITGDNNCLLYTSRCV